MHASFASSICLPVAATINGGTRCRVVLAAALGLNLILYIHSVLLANCHAAERRCNWPIDNKNGYM